MARCPGEEGVSEIIGVMLLVGVTVLAVAVVAAVLLSGPHPDEIPRATIVAGNESGRLALVHEGGDPLGAGEYRVYIDTGNGLADGTDMFSEPAGGVWSIGGTLVYNGAGTPERVVVTAVSGGGETILAEPDFRGGAAGFSPDPAEPGVMMTPGSDGGPSPVLIVSPGEGQKLVFSGNGQGNAHAAMKANITLQNVARVDFILYPFDQSRKNDKETLMRSVATNSDGDYIWDDIPLNLGLSKLNDGDKVVMIAVAYDIEGKVIGLGARVAIVDGLTS